MTDYHQILNVLDKKDWETPLEFVKGVEKNWEIRFTLDAAASKDNTKAPRFLDSETDALSDRSWGQLETVWINPPYGETEIPAFLMRALQALKNKEAKLIVFLIPNATENRVWHETIFPNASEICFIGGRLSFENNGKPVNGNTKGSVLVFFETNHTGPPRLGWKLRDEIVDKPTLYREKKSRQLKELEFKHSPLDLSKIE